MPGAVLGTANMEKKVMNKENRFLTSLTGKANKQIEKIKFSGPEAS